MAKLIHFTETLYAIGVFLFLFLFSLFFCGTLSLLLGINLSPILFVFSIFLSVILTFYLTKNRSLRIREYVLVFFFGFILIILSILSIGAYYDFSFDGQWYHQDAIIHLKNGWNPFYDKAIENESVSGLNANYVNHYPKATWIVECLIFQFTNNIEASKSIHLIAALSAFFISFSFFKREMQVKNTPSFLLSLMLVGSTITLGQLFSFYVDGILFSFLIVFCLFLWPLLTSFPNWKQWVLLGFAFFLLVNVKFTALVYSSLFIIGGLVFVTIKKRKLLFNYLYLFLLIGILGVCVFGGHTYVNNTFSKGHPFFPLMGKNNEGKTIAQVQYAKNFFELNRFEKFYASHFSIPQYTDHEHPSVSKPLFNSKLSKKSLIYYHNHQPVAMSPLGPIDAELIIFFLPLLLLFLIRNRNPWTFYILGIICLSIFIQPEFWNFRYSPQILFIFAVVCLFGFKNNSLWIKGYTFVFVLLFIANGLIASFQNWKWVNTKTQKLNSNLEQLSNKRVRVHRGWMGSFELKFNHYNIHPVYSVSEKDSLTTFDGDDFTNWKYVIEK